MNAFLWAIVVLGSFNTFCIMAVAYLQKELPPSTALSRFLECLVTLAFTVWAGVLLLEC